MKLGQNRIKERFSNVSCAAALVFGAYFGACSSHEPATVTDMPRSSKPVDMKEAADLAPAFVPFVVGKGTIAPLGDQNSPVTIVRYSDYTGRTDFLFYDKVWPPLLEKYVVDFAGTNVGKAVVYFRDYPNDTMKFATLAARSARCAGVVSKYWQMHDAQFASQSEWLVPNTNPRPLLREYARNLGVDMTEYTDCMDREYSNADIVADVVSMNALIESFKVPTQGPTHFLLIPKGRLTQTAIDKAYAIIGHPDTISFHEDKDNFVILLNGMSRIEYFEAFLDRVDYAKR